MNGRGKDRRSKVEKLSDLADSAERIGSKHEAEVATRKFFRELMRDPNSFFAGPLLRAFEDAIREKEKLDDAAVEGKTCKSALPVEEAKAGGER